MFPTRALLAVLVAVCIVFSGLAAAVPTAAAATASLVEEIETRDHLIADQEALLNVYRCMFAVDVAAVPGGCANGVPAQPAGEPGPPPPNPSKADKDARDNLIAAQENLLNAYRCNHNIDTQLVPGGCPEPVVEDETEEDTATEEEAAHTVTVPGNWEHMFLKQQLMLNPYQCLPNSEGVIRLSEYEAICTNGSTSALTGEIVVITGPDIPIVYEFDSEGNACRQYWGVRPDGQCYLGLEWLGFCSDYPNNMLFDFETGECFLYEPDDDS